MNKVWKSQQAIIGVVLLSSLFLGGCSVNNEKGAESKSSSSSSATVDASMDVNKDFEQAVLGTVTSSTIPPEQWYYTGGRQFSEEYFKSRVPQMASVCGQNDRGETLRNKEIVLLMEYPQSRQAAQEQLKVVEEYWESQGWKVSAGLSDSHSTTISATTDSGVFMDFMSGTERVSMQAKTPCITPGEPDPMAS